MIELFYCITSWRCVQKLHPSMIMNYFSHYMTQISDIICHAVCTGVDYAVESVGKTLL